MIEGQHIIEKVSVDVKVTSMALAEKIKLEVNDFIQNEVLSIIESYFLDISSEFDDTIIQLDKVSLSVDTSSWNIHSKELKQEIRNEVERKMNPILERAKDKSQLLKTKGVDDNEKFIDQDLQVYAKDERILKSLFYFLDNGTLPWWVASLEESREIFSEKIVLKTLKDNTIFAFRELEKRSSSTTFRDRLIQQFPRSVFTHLIALRLVGYTDERMLSLAINEIEVLPKEITKKAEKLIWQLTEKRSEITVFEKDAAVFLFQHIHTHFFQNKLEEIELNSSLRSTYSVLRFLYLVADKESEIGKMKIEFKKSLNKEVSPDILTPLKSTDAYKKMFPEINDTSDEQFNVSHHALLREELAESTEDVSINDTISKSENLLKDKGVDQSNEEESITNKEKKNERSEILESNDEFESNSNKLEFNIENETSDQSKEKIESTSADRNFDVQSNKSTLKNEALKRKLESENSIKSLKDFRQILENSVENSSNKRGKHTNKIPNDLFVNNAGLVLLNPFLPALFKQLELLSDDGELVHPELAACILHYAATGREGDFEFEMIFEKYLCGIPPAVSLEREITLTTVQKDEVEKVLNSTLEHWSALKSKSPALLQNEFLTRKGKLIIEKTNHRLVIEKKTFDLLLDKLPWSYSMIKFSWKKELIFVEW